MPVSRYLPASRLAIISIAVIIIEIIKYFIFLLDIKMIKGITFMINPAIEI
jgi:hypothetical protein